MSTTTTRRTTRARRYEVYNWAAELKAAGYSPKSIKVKTKTVTTVAAGVGCLPWELTPERIKAYLICRPLKPETRAAYMVAIRQYAQWAKIPDPTEGIRRPRRSRRVPNPISERDLATLLRHTTGDTRLYVLLGAFLGLRAHEVAQIHAQDFLDDPDGVLYLRITGKGNTFDILPVPQVVLDELGPRLNAVGYLFPGRVGPHVTPESVSVRVQRAASKLGIRMRFHMLRHRFGTQIHRSKGDLLITQHAMRHADPTATAGYAKVADGARNAVVLALPIPKYVFPIDEGQAA